MTIMQRLEAAGCGCDAVDAQTGMVSIDDAMARLRDGVGPVGGTERVALGSARGRVLAESVVVRTMLPPFANSAMDGYALSTAALSGTGPWQLPLSGRILAGQSPDGHDVGRTAVQVFTGAPLPAGADAVVMQEHVRRDGDRIFLTGRPHPGQHVRPAGDDMLPGQIVAPAGARLGASGIAAIAAAGQGTVEVRRRLRVALLATGDEIRPAGADLGGSAIWDVNTPMLAALMDRPDVETVDVALRGDSPGAIRAAISDLAGDVDVIVTTGGISVGAADFVRPAIRDLGGETLFSGVAIKPGKPVSLARLGRALWLGLPGNPLSAFVTWTLFGTVLLDRLTGSGDAPARRHVVAAGPMRHVPGRCELRFARIEGHDGLGREVVSCPEATHSARVSQMIGTDGLVLLPADTEGVPEGGLLEFLPIRCT